MGYQQASLCPSLGRMWFCDHLMPQGPSSAWHPGGPRKHLWNESEWEVLRIVQVRSGEGLAGNASEAANWVECGQGAPAGGEWSARRVVNGKTSLAGVGACRPRSLGCPPDAQGRSC